MSVNVNYTINRDLPRLHDIEAISRDSCHGAQARWYRGSYDVLLHRFYTEELVLSSDTKMLLPSASLG